jgi:hypothetical protein
MERLVTAVILSGMAIVQMASAQSRVTAPISAVDSAANRVSTGINDIPPVPHGRSTVFGGEIRDLDPVRNQLTLKVFGERPMKILFDERTEAYRDGKRVPLREVRPEEQASVQTILDGSKLFALSIHVLSNAEQGEYEGRVLRFNPATGELEVAAGQSQETIRLLVTGTTSFERSGQSRFASQRAGASDMAAGALISAQFGASSKGEPVANRITILAVPGSSFVFGGTVSSLDLRSGLMVVVDQRDQKSYALSFNPGLPAVQQLHVGDGVRAVTNYDGVHYIATEITHQ